MFGYVTPCKMELKIKDYEKFKAYYCGLCHSIKNNIGNVPRMALNYDMTFLAILLDSLNNVDPIYTKRKCAVHAFKGKVVIKNNPCLDYAAFCNTTLSYYKFLDNVNDDNSIKGKVFSLLFKNYLKKAPEDFKKYIAHIEDVLTKLYTLEANAKGASIDSLAHHFADLTGFILSSYKEDDNKEPLYWLGYNLGKWIYIIDAFDDLKDDMSHQKFNAVNFCFNKDNLSYEEFSKQIEQRIDFILGTCASQCVSFLNNLQIKKNEDLLYNILQYGLLEKMDKVFKRSADKDEKSI